MKKTELTKIIAYTLKDLGIPAGLIGYHYLKDAIAEMMNDMTLINAITKELYPMLAKRFNATNYSVERGIRHAIEVGFERGNIETQTKLFGYSVDQNKGKPTNCEFIATVADYLIMEGYV